MDETYIHGSHINAMCCSDDMIHGLLAPISGQRLLIIHAGGEQGFVPLHTSISSHTEVQETITVMQIS
jgi:hypothetical protein